MEVNMVGECCNSPEKTKLRNAAGVDSKASLQKYKIFNIENAGKVDLNEEQENYMISLIGEKLNGMPLLGSYLKDDCVLERAVFIENRADYWLSLYKESVKVIDGRPVKIISRSKLKCIHYLRNNMILLCYKDAEDYRRVANIISLIPLSLKIKTERGFSLNYTVPKISEPILGELKFGILKSFIYTILRVKTRSDSVKNQEYFHRHDHFNHIEVSEEKEKLKGILRGKGKAVEFYYKDSLGIRQKLLIKCSGDIESSLSASTELLGELASLFHFLWKCEDASEYLISLDSCLEEFLNFVHKDMAEEVRKRQKRLILDEAKELIYLLHREQGQEYSESITYDTVIFNTLIMLCYGRKLKNGKANFPLEIEPLDFSNLITFLRLYGRKLYNVIKSDNDVRNSMILLGGIIEQCGGREEKIPGYLSKNN
jgi:hypothetical protein